MRNILKWIRHTDSETPERTEEEVAEGVLREEDLVESVSAEDAVEHRESVAGNVADKVKGMAEGTARIAKTAGGATARGVTTVWEIAGNGLKTGSAVAGQGARSAGSRLKTAGGITAEGARRAGSGIKNVAGSAATGVVTVGGAVAGTATGVGAKTWDAIDDRVESCWAVVRETLIRRTVYKFLFEEPRPFDWSGFAGSCTACSAGVA